MIGSAEKQTYVIAETTVGPIKTDAFLETGMESYQIGDTASQTVTMRVASYADATVEPPRNIRNITNLHNVRKAVERSREILTWEDNWDGEGSRGYTQDTWERANDFLMRNVKKAWATCGVQTPTPHVWAGPKGGIDIMWRTDNVKLLITIPADRAAPASFYGKNFKNETIEGDLHPSTDNQWLFQWLVK